MDLDVDFEPLLAGLERVVATGDRAAELALRCKYAGFASERIDVVPDLRAGLERGLALGDPADELVVLPTYTAMLVAARAHRRARCVRPYWEQAA